MSKVPVSSSLVGVVPSRWVEWCVHDIEIFQAAWQCGLMRKSVSKTVLHKEMCMEPVAKGWLRSSIALWERLQAAPSNSILGITVRESIKRAQAAPKRNTSWAGRFLSMMHMITGQGSRDDAATVQDFVKQFGFDSTADRILPVPSGVVWAAWEKFVQVEPWENLESNPRTAPTARIRLVTYNNWFAVPHGTGGTQEKGYPPGMPNYITVAPHACRWVCQCKIHTHYDDDYIMAPQRGRPYGANLGSMGRNTGTWSIRSECLSNITSWSRRKGIENTTLPFIPE